MSDGARLKAVRMAAGLSLSEMSARTHYSRSYLSNVENERKATTLEIVRSYEKVLGVDLADGASTRFQPDHGVDRPARTDYADEHCLKSIKDHVQEIVALDNRFGGGDLVGLSLRFFRSVHDQLGAGAYDPALERELHAAAGELAEVCGWLAYDAEEHDLVRRMNQESLYFTRLAGDVDLELLTLQNMSMHTAAQGRPREALRIVRSVLEGNYELSSRLRALFLMRKARVLAQCGDGGALALVPQVRSLFAEGVANADPSWAWWVDERELDWHEAMMRRDLKLEGNGVELFEQSVARIPAAEVRSQYVHRAHLLQAQVDNRSWSAAERTVREILPLVAEVASRRAALVLESALTGIAHARTVPRSLCEQAALARAQLRRSAW